VLYWWACSWTQIVGIVSQEVGYSSLNSPSLHLLATFLPYNAQEPHSRNHRISFPGPGNQWMSFDLLPMPAFVGMISINFLSKLSTN
jgi:hypothetical protein